VGDPMGECIGMTDTLCSGSSKVMHALARFF
jgi:hypothetical protein